MTYEPSMIGVAIVGCGRMGTLHAASLAGRGARVLYACDVDPLARVRLTARHPECRVSREMGGLLEDPAVEAVVIASYDAAHGQQVKDALLCGKHVLVEKPLCYTLRELKDIRLAWEHSGKVLAVNLPMRTWPCFQRLKAVIESGEMGEIYAFDADYLWGRLWKLTEGWRGKQKPYYSPILGAGIHVVDLMMWATGWRPLRVGVEANGICTFGNPLMNRGDYITLAFDFGSGVIGRASVNMGCVLPHQHRVSVYGTQGTFTYDRSLGAVLTKEDRSNDTDPPLRGKSYVSVSCGAAPAEQYVEAVVGGFLDAVSSGRPPDVQGVFDSHAVCIAADDVWMRGTVTVDYI